MTDLFGGALKAKLPNHHVDISNLREIPDNQEVFAHMTTDQSLIIEVMEYQPAEDDNQAIRTYFEDLAETNSAQVDISTFEYQSVDLSQLSAQQCRGCILMAGIQQVSKFKDTVANKVLVEMALLRLPQFTSDILITYNNPVEIGAGSSSEKAAPSTSEQAWKSSDFLETVKSLTIVDEGLFG